MQDLQYEWLKSNFKSAQQDQVENQFSKSFLLLEKYHSTQESNWYFYALTDLQILFYRRQRNFHAEKSILKNILKHAKSCLNAPAVSALSGSAPSASSAGSTTTGPSGPAEMFNISPWRWFCHFYTRKLESFPFQAWTLENHDWDAYYSTSKECLDLALNANDHHQACLYLLHRIQVSFTLADTIEALRDYRIVLDSLMQIKSLLTMLSNDAKVKQTSLGYIKKMYLLFQSSFYLCTGVMDEAMSTVSKLQVVLDEQGGLDPTLIVSSEMKDDLLDPALNQLEKGGGRILFIGTKIPYLVSYLLSALVHKFKDHAKSILFLKEGLDAVSVELEKSPDCGPLKELKVYMLMEMFDVYCYTSLLCDAVEVLVKTTQCIDVDPYLFAAFEESIMFRWACIFHCIGFYEKAKTIYQKLIKGQGRGETRWISRVNLYLLNLSTSNQVDSTCLDTLKKTMNPLDSRQTILMNLVEASTFNASHEFQNTKKHLLDAFKKATQFNDGLLVSMCLLFISHLFWDTNHGKAVDMLEKAVNLGAKVGNLPLSIACGLKAQTLDCTSETKDQVVQIQSRWKDEKDQVVGVLRNMGISAE